MRAKGVIVYSSPSNPIAEEAERHQKQLQEERRGEAAKRAARPVPNWICYPEAFDGLVGENGKWLGNGKVPACRVCQGSLQPEENHVCPGYHSKYPMLPSSELSFEERKALRHAAWEQAGDWDDDHYDPTTDGEIPMRNPDEEDSGVVSDFMTEEDWIAAKRRRMGLAPGYDTPDFEPEED